MASDPHVDRVGNASAGGVRAMEDAGGEARLDAWERRTDASLTVLSLLFLLLYAAQVLATRPGDLGYTVLDGALWAIWAAFVVDYVGRLVCARARWRFVLRHPLDLIIVLAPFFRFLRLLRLVAAVSVLGRVLRDDFRGRVSVYLVTSVALLGTVGALGVYEAERDAPEATITTFGDALWWVATTITTVGYGDRYPVTVEGRLVAAGLMVAGIAVLGTVTASIASWFLEQVEAASAEKTPVVEKTAASDRMDEVLAELRALRARLDQLEAGPLGAGTVPPAPVNAAVTPPGPAAGSPAPAPPPRRPG